MLSNEVYNIIKDYQCDLSNPKFKLSPNHVEKWANQFGEDSSFVLKEMLHLLPEIYISKSKATDLLRTRLLEFQKYYKYKTMNEFIMNTHFINVQKPEKSQNEILSIVDSILQNEFLIDYKEYCTHKKKHFIYFDDLLATGGTIFRDLKNWLDEDIEGVNNATAILGKEKTLAISLFCYHSLGFNNLEWQLMKHTKDEIKKILLFGVDYIIENDLKTKFLAEQQRLNCAYPIDEQSKIVIDYFNSISSTSNNVPAFRSKNLPKTETFFSNAENRIKLENLFLEKGVELLNKVKSKTPDPRKRPLGDTVRGHKTLGTGTLFFTWRNISNTCPLVFWWDVPSHNWIPLFCVKNRGI